MILQTCDSHANSRASRIESRTKRSIMSFECTSMMIIVLIFLRSCEVMDGERICEGGRNPKRNREEKRESLGVANRVVETLLVHSCFLIESPRNMH